MDNPRPDIIAALSNPADEAAVTRLMTEYEPLVRLLVRRQLARGPRTEFDSSDLVQSVWVRVLRVLREGGQFAEVGQFEAFLVKVTRNRIIDHQRRQAHQTEHRLPFDAAGGRAVDPGPRPSQLAGEKELWDRMQQLCPPEHRDLLRLKQAGLSVAEAAEATGLHPGSVRRILADLSRRVALAGRDPGE